jgi:hypothetical protein
MKKSLLLVFLSLSFYTLIAQPIIEGAYFPVRNTRITQIFDTAATNLTIPTTGPNQIWDYSSQFILSDTGGLWTMDPSSTPFSSFHPTANLSVYSLSPRPAENNKYTYIMVDTIGISIVGFGTNSSSPAEFMIPNILEYSYSSIDTNIYLDSGIFTSPPVPYLIKKYRVKQSNPIGYGRLITPALNYNDVMLVKEEINDFDSIFIDSGSGYVFYDATNPILTHRYSFLRNNTFATTYLMQLHSDSTDAIVNFGWYTLPADIGSISGTVYDTSGLAITSGEMLLYREHSNHTRNDILATTQVDASGNYQFDSIPYGEYRIACRPDLNTYVNAMTTYVGDTTDWINCQTIITSGNSIGNDINLIYHNSQIGAGSISGSLFRDYSFSKGSGDPIPGIDIIIEKTPSGAVNNSNGSNSGGGFSFNNLNDGDYTIFVDIPGLNMNGSYNFTISGGTTVSGLDFKVGFDSIHPVGTITTIQPIAINKGLVSAYPNPFSTNTTIELEMIESSNVEINIFNLLGKRMVGLVNEKLNTGIHTFNFSAASYAKGIYIAKIKIDDKEQVIKLIQK